MLPADKDMRILGIPNRLALAIFGSVFCVFVEVLLNFVNALTWDYSWWSARAPWLIFLIGYFPFFAVAFWVHDMKSLRSKLTTVGVIYTVNIASLIVFGAILGWI